MASSKTYEFLFVKTGDHVVIKNEEPPGNTRNGRDGYWIGQVINCIGEEQGIQIHGRCFKLRTLIMERS